MLSKWWKRTSIQVGSSPTDYEEALLPGKVESEDEEVFETSAIHLLSRRIWLWKAGLLVLVASLAGNAALWSAYTNKQPTDQECSAQLSVWSPVNEVLGYKTYDFDNPFAHKTVYRGPPSPELDRAWGKLWLYNGVRIPESKLQALNRTADLGGGRRYKTLGGAEGGYSGWLEVFHQLHCLNLIRQYTWRDYYLRHQDTLEAPVDMLVDDVTARMHVDHCIEALRISLMCMADTTPALTIVDPEVSGGFTADFSAHHKCRDFEALTDWVTKHQVSDPGEDFDALGHSVHHDAAQTAHLAA